MSALFTLGLLGGPNMEGETVTTMSNRAGTGIKRAFSVGLLLLLIGVVIAVATWPHAQSDALGDTRYENAVRADLGLAAAMLGLLLVLLAGIAYGIQRLESVHQETKA